MGVFGGENKEKAEVELRLKADQTKKELLEVGESIKKLKKEKKELEAIDFAPDSATALRYKSIDDELKRLNKSKKDLNSSFKESLTVIINGEVAGKSLNSLEAALKRVRNERKKFASDSDDFKNATASINKITGEIDKLNAPLKKSTGFWQGLGKEVKAFGILAGSYLGLQFLSSQVTNIISKNAKLSDSLADVQRVAGLTKDEVGLLNTQLGKIDTRTGRAELLSIAIVAGKLGVAKGDIFDFTKAVDQLVVALGDELGNADEITTQLGKILNVFKGKVTADDLTKLGNAFVELANNGVATGGFIADFTQRVSGIAKASNLSLGATVGLAAGFEELGLRSESSATALQKLISTIAADIPGAAKIAGIEVGKFNELFSKNPEQALIAYAKGLTQNKESFSAITKSFKDAGEEGARVVQTLQAIGQSGDFLSKKIDLGNTSLTNSNAILEAFALKNETLGAKVDKLGKALYGAFSNPVVTKAIDSLVSILSKLAPAQEKLTASSSRVVAANRNQTVSAKALLDEYNKLYYTTSRTAEQKDRMNAIAVELKDILGASAVQINKETRALEVNRAAVRDLVREKEIENAKLIAGLIERKQALAKSDAEDAARLQNSAKELALSKAGITNGGISEKKASEIGNFIEKGSVTLSPAEVEADYINQYGEQNIEAVKRYYAAINKFKLDNAKLNDSIAERNGIDAQLKAFGYDASKWASMDALIKQQADKMKQLVDETKPGAQVGSSDSGDGNILTGDKEKKQQDKLAKQEKDSYETRIKNFQDFMDERMRAQEKGAAEEEEKQKELNDFLIEQDLATADFRKNNAPQFGPDTRRNYDLELVMLENHYNKIKDFDETALNDKISTSRKEFEIRTREMVRGSQEYQTELAKQLIAENAIIEDNNAQQQLAQREHNREMAQYVFEYVNLAQQYLQTYYNQQQNEQDAQLAEDKKYHDQKVDQLNTELNEKRISQQDYNKKLAGLDNDYKRKEYEANKKQFERNKRLAEANILVGTAEGIIKIWQQSSNVYVAALESLALAGLAAYQISVIEKQQYPKYAEGGIMLDGPSHENGGIDVVSGGRKVAELEGGEVIGSTDFVGDHPYLARSIADYHKNGKRLDFSGSADAERIDGTNVTGKGLVNYTGDVAERIQKGNITGRGLVNLTSDVAFRAGIKTTTPIPQFNSTMAGRNVMEQRVFEKGGFWGTAKGAVKDYVRHKTGATESDLLDSSASLNELVAESNKLLARINETIAKSEGKQAKVTFVQKEYDEFTKLNFEARKQTVIG